MRQSEADKYFKDSKSYEIMDVYNEDDVNPIETQEKDDPERLALARTAWGEGRNQGRDGMHLIQNVIKNRANSGGAYNWPENVFDVTRQSKQFSAWNPNDPNKAKMEALEDANVKVVSNPTKIGKAVKTLENMDKNKNKRTQTKSEVLPQQ